MKYNWGEWNLPEDERKIGENFIYNVFLKLSGIIFELATYPYVARILLPEGMGRVTVVTSVVAYFVICVQLGIPTYGVRACVQVRSDRKKLSRLVQELLCIILIQNIIVYGAFFIFIKFVPHANQEKNLYLILGLTVFLNSIGLEWLYHAVEDFRYISMCTMLFRIIAAVLILIIVRTPGDVEKYAGLTVLAMSGANLFSFLHARKYMDLFPVQQLHLINHIKPVFIFFALACATTIYTNLDNVMLGAIAGNVQVGYYGSAVNVKKVLVSVVLAFGSVLLPRASYYFENHQTEAFYELLDKSMRVIILSAVLLSGYFICFSKECILILSGKNFLDAVVPMQVIMPTVLLIGITNIIGIQILIPTGREIVTFYSTLAGAAVDVLINALLIPSMGATGAAIGTLIAEGVVLVFQLAAVGGKVRKMLGAVEWPKYCLAMFAGILGTAWTRRLPVHPFFILVISAVCYAGIAILCLYAMRDKTVRRIAETARHRIWKRQR